MDLKNNRYVKSGKWAVLAVVGMGTKKIVEDIVATNVTPGNVRQKVAVKVATYGLAAAAALLIKRQLDKEINMGLAIWENIFEMVDSVMEGDVDEEESSDIPTPPSDLEDKSDPRVLDLAA